MTSKLMSRADNDGRIEKDEEKHRNEFTHLLGGQLDCNEALQRVQLCHRGIRRYPRNLSCFLKIHLFKITSSTYGLNSLALHGGCLIESDIRFPKMKCSPEALDLFDPSLATKPELNVAATFFIWRGVLG